MKARTRYLLLTTKSVFLVPVLILLFILAAPMASSLFLAPSFEGASAVTAQNMANERRLADNPFQESRSHSLQNDLQHDQKHSLQHDQSHSQHHPLAPKVPLGFSMFNGRNHPELDWQTAETEHFLIQYPKHLEGIELQAASIAEATYEALSANLGVTFDYKIRIYLSDEDEIVNGYAMPFWKSYTNIWVALNDVAEGWSGPEKWLRTVLAHELAHIFHFEAVKSNVGLLGTLLTAPALPAPWTEGIAQYQTEPWHALRGDAILRTSIYDGAPDFRDGRSMQNRGLMYASGNAQLRYFASVYGDSLLPKILSHRKELFGGRMKVHNFEEAFEEVTGTSFADFEEEWRRHMSIYYYTLAGQMERSDSLASDPLELPGLFKGEAAFSPDGSQLAAIYLVSGAKPYERLSVFRNDSTMAETVLDEGAFTGQLKWHPDGSELVYGRSTRGENGSIVNDLYRVRVDGKPERLTHSRRAKNADYTPDGQSIVYVVNENGTGNLFSMNLSDRLKSGRSDSDRSDSGRSETRITSYEGDSQIGAIDVHPTRPVVAYALFAKDGARQISVRNWETGETIMLTDGMLDDRNPVWSPDGQQLLYTSLRDDVPNLFVIHPFEGTGSDAISDEERVTALFTGASALQWVWADSSSHQPEQKNGQGEELGEVQNVETDAGKGVSGTDGPADGWILVRRSDSKMDNELQLIDASRRASVSSYPERALLPDEYTRWTTHRPPNVIAPVIAPDPSLIQARRPYDSFQQISHIATVPFPVYDEEIGAGVGVFTAFSEPLSKHMITGLGYVSFQDPGENSLLLLNYTNNQLRPSLNFSLYHNSFTSRLYEDEFLVTTNSGLSVLGLLPRDWIDSPFGAGSLFSRLRFDYTDSDRFWERDDLPPFSPLGDPQSGWQTDLTLGLQLKKQKPYAFNVIHPLDGWGVEPKLTLATKALGGETEYLRADLKAYTILPFLGNSRFYLYGRALAQSGTAFNQDYIGFSRYDEITFGELVPGIDLFYRDTERVRGFREVATGNRMLFSTVEYRLPFLPSLETQILGLVGFGRTTLSAFLDVGAVWSDDLLPDDAADGTVTRAGAGFELKNVLNLFGVPILHSIGYAQPFEDFGTERNQEIYYRVRATVAF